MVIFLTASLCGFLIIAAFLYYSLFYYYYKKGETASNSQDKIYLFSKANDLLPNKVTYLNRGTAFLDLKQYNQAISDYSRALKLDPKYLAAYYNRAQVYRQIDNHKKAIEDYTSVLEIDPNYYKAFNNRAVRYKKLKEYDNALADYTQLIKLKPNVFHLNNRASLLIKMKPYNPALYDYSRIIKLEPENVTGYQGEGIVFMLYNQYNRAFNAFNYSWHLDENNLFSSLFSVISAAEISEKKYLAQKDKLNSVKAKTPWAQAILEVYKGTLEADDMLKSKVMDKKDFFKTYFYIGMEYVNREEKEKGKNYLKLCLSHGENSEYMYKLAKEKLDKIGYKSPAQSNE